jgi:hypothetical protein
MSGHDRLLSRGSLQGAPGVCGCGVTDADSEGNGAVECVTSSIAFGAVRPAAGGRVSFRVFGSGGQARDSLRYLHGLNAFVAAGFTAFVVGGTARTAGLGTDGRRFSPWHTTVRRTSSGCGSTASSRRETAHWRVAVCW